MPKRSRAANQWFGRGSDAFRCFGLDLPPYYVCPLCLHGFLPEEAHALTREHVPPLAVGGSKLVLTCWRCNNHASGKQGVDTHASVAEKVRRFGEGTLGEAVRARLSIESLHINVNVQTENGEISITGLPNHNPPGMTDGLQRVLDEYMATGCKDVPLSLFFPDFDCSEPKQQSSWLRAGYLAAFASFGYRFIFRPLFDPIRAQIRDPDRSLFSFFHFVRKESLVPSRFLMVVQDPEWIKGILVQMGRHYVLLPMSDGDHNFYARLEKGALQSPKLNLSGKLFPWPASPEYRLDCQPTRQTSPAANLSS